MGEKMAYCGRHVDQWFRYSLDNVELWIYVLVIHEYAHGYWYGVTLSHIDSGSQRFVSS